MLSGPCSELVCFFVTLLKLNPVLRQEQLTRRNEADIQWLSESSLLKLKSDLQKNNTTATEAQWRCKQHKALTYLGFSSLLQSAVSRILGKVSAVTVCHNLTAKRKQPAPHPPPCLHSKQKVLLLFQIFQFCIWGKRKVSMQTECLSTKLLLH